MKEHKLTLLIGALSLIIGVFIGNMTKPIPECEKCVYVPPNEVIERIEIKVEEEKKKIEIETNEKIKEIITSPDVSVSDSILRLYAKSRFGYN